MQVLKDDVQNRIVNAAVKEFSDNGYRQASLRRIASSAGTSVSNVYHYFKGKEQLFRHIVSPVYDTLMQMAGGVFAEGQPKMDAGSIAEALLTFLKHSSRSERGIMVLLVEKSEGSAYAGTKQNIIDQLKHHFAREIRNPCGIDADAHGLEDVYGIIASNYISGLIGLVAQYRDERWAETSLRAFLHYHACGINGLKGE